MEFQTQFLSKNIFCVNYAIGTCSLNIFGGRCAQTLLYNLLAETTQNLNSLLHISDTQSLKWLTAKLFILCCLTDRLQSSSVLSPIFTGPISTASLFARNYSKWIFLSSFWHSVKTLCSILSMWINFIPYGKHTLSLP